MRTRRFFFDRWHPFLQILFLLALSLSFAGVLTMLATMLCKPLFGVEAVDVMIQRVTDHPESAQPNELSALKFIQFLSSLGAFVLAAALFASLKFPRGDYLRVNRRLRINLVIIAMLILIASLPFNGLLQQFNSTWPLPGGLGETLQSLSDKNDKLIDLFLSMPNITSLLINLIVIAILPALGEEMFFRGCLQQVLREWLHQPFPAICISAFLFSALHGEFYNFLPIFVLGLMLGYLFYWSRNLWVTIGAHATFNGLQVIAVYLHQHGMMEYDVNSNTGVPLLVGLASLVITIALIYFFRKQSERRAFIY